MTEDWAKWLQDMAGDAAKTDVGAVLGGFWPKSSDGQGPWSTPMGDPTEMFRTMWETWFTMAESMMTNMWGMGQQMASTAAAATDPPTQESLSVDVVAGEAALGTLWLKNRSSTTLDDVRVRSTTLEDYRGQTISGGHVDCRLHGADQVIAGANVRVDVTVRPPVDTAPGVYHGVLLVDEHEGACRPIRVRVVG